MVLDLLDNTPAMPDDLGKNVRELLSLRLLESFSAQGALASPVSSPASQKIRLDPSDCCEDVLRQILAEDLNNKSVEEQEQDHSIEEPKECDKEVFNSHKQTNEGVDKFDGKKRQDRAAEDAEGGRKDLRGLITSDNDMDKLEQTFRKNVSIGEAEQYNGVPSDSDGLPNNLPNENLEEIFLCSSYRAIPHPRRPRIRWTKKEEKALKKWKRKLHNDDDKSIPYKEILEAGAGVFHPRRTPTDLKDKWRNICKANLRTA
ncbi:hypothetical protein MIMGU_mgv1a012220mg [Erythranthe guttata]|uniref:Myb-like domain-containing protein n=1 Tax=Erythranthe guttata TaxID=4155 RepID=A0A022S3A9_ERYGU|nr:hypothetical protein MIMGU_mgv1a012220mg [Erythranthe guttata]